jgi:thiamine transporter
MQKINSRNAQLIRILVYSAMCLALAFVLSRIIIFRMPQGGSVTLASMLFVALTGYWFGFRSGLVAGIAFGLLRIQFGGYVLTPVQAALDYVVAYGALGGLAGVFSGRRFGQYGLIIGYLAGVTGLFLANFTAGVVFFGDNAPEGQHVFVFSALYNLAHTVPEVVLTIAILSLPHFKHALERVSPKGSILATGKAVQLVEKFKMPKLHYIIAATALIVLFYTAPLAHLDETIRTDATGWNIAMGTLIHIPALTDGASPAIFALLFAPFMLLVLLLAKAPTRAVLLAAASGFVIHCLFMFGANRILDDMLIIRREVEYVPSLTIINWVILLVYAGLVIGLRYEKEENV